MTLHLSLDAYLFFLINPKSIWWKQRNKYLNLYRPKVCWRINHATHLRVFHTSGPRCKWARSRTFWYDKYIYSHDFLYYRVSKLLTSSKGFTKVNNRMSRIKNTIESVSKAVSGTHSELVSRIARLKSHSDTLGKANKSNVDANNINANLENDKQVTDARTQEDCNRGPAAKKSTCANGNLESMLVSSSGSNQDTPEDSASIKNHLFHISYFSTNFGETYNFVADHINWYFNNNSVMDQEKKRNALLQDSKSEERNKLDSSENAVMSGEKTVDSAADAETLGAEKTDSALPVSTKKSIANFLSYPSNSVQAFVDSYIGGLVPKLRSDTKVVSQEKSKRPEQEVSEKDEEDKAQEAKTAEEREKHLSLQREKIIARVSIDNRTRALVQALRRSSNRRICISRVEELTYHLLEFPESRGVAIKEKLIPCLLRLRQASDESLQAAVRETLAIIGYTDPVKGWGIRVLTIDGGGTRGLVALQTLRKLEELTGKPVHQLFDYICGVSTGAILAFMLGLFHIPLDDCEELYRKLGSDVFKQNVIVGTVKMGWSHAFYDSDIWEKMLKEKMGSNLMIETARNSKCPKVAAVSTIVNRGTPLKAFVFRNYNHFPGVKSHYIGGCQYKLWQAIRASSAAPGYFQEYVLGNDLHQDGGLLLNNPSALAVHECKCLWPSVPLQCLISLGTGRYESEGKTNVTYTSLKAKLTNVISSATDTEESPSDTQAAELMTSPVTLLLVPAGDYVSLLNTYSQKTLQIVDYPNKKRTGDAHAPMFSCSCTINGFVYGIGTGTSLAAAKQAAAKQAYEKLNKEGALTMGSEKSNGSSTFSEHSNSSQMPTLSDLGNSTNCFQVSSAKLVEKMKDMAVCKKPSPSQRHAQSSALKSRRKLAANFHNARNKEEKTMSDSDESLPDLDTNTSEENENPYTVNKRFLESFKNIEPIGEGGYGNVFKATAKLDEGTYAVKRVQFTKNVKREVKELARLHHENIVRYYCSWKGYDHVTYPDSRQKSDKEILCLFIQMELCEQGPLENWIEKNRQDRKYHEMAQNKFLQILEGVKYIHSQGLIHRDLKPQNIFISHEDKIKIGDLGLVTSVAYGTLSENRGTKSYMAPEQFGDRYGKEVDIYALGLIWFEILSALSCHEKITVWHDVREGKLPKSFTDQFLTEAPIIKKMLSRDSSGRYSASEILEFFKSVDKNNSLRTHSQ